MILGILFLIATGSSWVVIGAVIGHASKRGLPVATIQACSAAVSLLVSASVLFCHPDPECAFPVRFWTMASIFGSGFFNYFVLQLMAKAMKSGPNGIVWAIVQSALVFPFLIGVICFGVALTAPRLGGIVAIVFALALFGLARDNRAHGSGWRAAAIGSLLLAGLNQNLSNLPSYFPEAAAVGSVSRSLSAALGALTAFLLANRHSLPSRLGDLANPILWRYTACLVASGLPTGYFMLYRGLNLVAAAGAGAVSYPVLVSSCIVSFTLYSLFILKEKIKPLQFGGIGLALAGIVLITLKLSS